jgi:hypothetical protein
MGVIIPLHSELNHSFIFLHYKLKTKLIYAMGIIFFFMVIFEVHYIWYQRKSYNTGPEQGHINFLVYIF